ncbi:reticulon-4-interacting protein 1, mitochondrial precursor [Boeremia exigua]|uniref:reticulon-4-interacting protein 1, mitochondrial precursor n=1 Tax=Boeremia exigua TaxID=749465 RepID=UPI001E8DCB5B|nr:reticulon-4-interacting protein 1, mitochondrial precursor [Boeremia exigua]KAH6620584.1 reticulon-4-interacting protein 1, mitochondrial precursor [Boeremia exigua]
MTTMEAWQCKTFSGAVEKNLYLATSVPKPIPTDTEVIVEVFSTSVNPIDYKILELGLIPRLALKAPVTPGLDISGRVVEVGSKVNTFKTGDIVYGACNGVFEHGAMAQYVQASQDMIALAPQGARHEDLAAVATVGMTTLQAIRPYVKASDKVFINGGSGGTGTLAIQIAKQLGCHVTTSCSTANVELCKSLGADEVLDYKKADIVEQLNARETRFEAIIDNVGNPSNLYRAGGRYLQPKGTFVQVGLGMDLAALRQFMGNKFLPGFLGGGRGKYVFAITKPNKADFELLGSWFETGKIRAVIDSEYKFSAAPEAFSRLKTGRSRGKVVVRVQEA